MKGKEKTQEAVLSPVEDLAMDREVPAWEVAGLQRAMGWAEGKQVTEAEFDAALERFRNRPQGGGRI